VFELLSTKEEDIINYLEKKYESISTIKSKLCAIYKVYKILNIAGQLFKNKFDYYAKKQTIHQVEKKELN
jgi:hypothetical protein